MGNLRASERTLRARSAAVYVLVNPESAVCACSSDRLSLPAPGQEGTRLSVPVCYVSPACGCC